MEPTVTPLSTVVDNSSASSGGTASPENDEVTGILSYEQWVMKNMETQQYIPYFMMDDKAEKSGPQPSYVHPLPKYIIYF